jgi:hypothetical protein
MNEVKTWVFEQTVHRERGMDKTTWEYHGTEQGAKKEFQDLISRTFSPYVTFYYWEKKDRE